jgi:D-alanine-D-alanine ligase
MGGVSTEHEISLKSGINVANALNGDPYTVVPVVLARDGNWHVPEKPLDSGETVVAEQLTALPARYAADALQRFAELSVDVAFIALHGKGGEDGQIQGFLKTAGIPFTGSDVLGNAVCMDKILTKRILEQSGVPVAKDVVVPTRVIPCDMVLFVDRIIRDIGFPCVVKISNQGSSHNVAIARDGAELTKALGDFKDAGEEILVEEFIKGRELTCAVIDSHEHGRAFALPPTELRPVESEWFDYHAKYTPGATDEITPAPIDESTTGLVQQLASRCHKLLHCSGMSRTDMFLRDNDLYVIEINTVPGLTETSLIPQAAAAAGIKFRQLLDIQIRWALEQ